MKSLVKKVWVLPLFGLMFFWGVSMMAIPSNTSLVSGHSLVAATKISPIKSLINERDEASVTIRGRVVRFKEHEDLVINDGTEQITVEYKDKYKPLKLSVGQTILVKGELSVDRNDYREVLAQEIYDQNRRIYPQKDMTTKIQTDQAPKTRFSSDQSSKASFGQYGQTLSIQEIFRDTLTGKTVTVEGTIVELPDEDLVLLRDSAGDKILIDVDDAPKTLGLRKGDFVNVEAIVINGRNGQKELEAMKIRKSS